MALVLFTFVSSTAQNQTLSLQDAVQMGIRNSRPLKRSQYKINEAMASSGFWDSQEKAQKQVNELKMLNAALKPINELCAGADDLGV